MWFKCNNGVGSSPEPPEWDWQIEDEDFTSEDPRDFTLEESDNINYLIEFNVDTNVGIYDNNNSIGFLSKTKEEQEPLYMDVSTQFTINPEKVTVFIRGRLCFSDSSAEAQAVGEIVGATRTFEGDYRNKDFRVTTSGGTTYFYVKENDQYVELTRTRVVGVPIAWEEGHEGEWEYITDHYFGKLNNSVVIGSYDGGSSLSTHYFEGHVNYLRVKY